MPLEWEKKREWKSIGNNRYCCATKDDPNVPHLEICIRRVNWGRSHFKQEEATKEPVIHTGRPGRATQSVNIPQPPTNSQSYSMGPDLSVSCAAIDTDAISCAICKHDSWISTGAPKLSCSAINQNGSTKCSRVDGHGGLHHSHGASLLYTQWRDANCCSVRYSPPSLSSGAQHRHRICELEAGHAGWHQITHWDGKKERYP